MKKTYEMPMLEVTAFDSKDVITTSNYPAEVEIIDNYLNFSNLMAME